VHRQQLTSEFSKYASSSASEKEDAVATGPFGQRMGGRGGTSECAACGTSACLINAATATLPRHYPWCSFIA
jgi:hypothetical protein